jgi:hypothetical protein
MAMFKNIERIGQIFRFAGTHNFCSDHKEDKKINFQSGGNVTDKFVKENRFTLRKEQKL